MRLNYIFNIIGIFFFVLILVLPIQNSYAYCGDGGLESAHEECDDGNFINRDGCSEFCKIEDMTPPEVSSVSITNKSTSIDTLTKTIDIVFSEEMDEITITKYNVYLEYKANPLDTTLTVSDDKKTVTLTLNESLYSEANHAIKVKNVKDISGNILVGDYDGVYISTFATAKEVDIYPPTVKVVPVGGTYNVAQSVTLTPYIGNYTKSDEFIDETATIYYTLNDVDITNKSPVYTTPLSIRDGTTLRYFAVDGIGNKTPILTERYSFKCKDFPNAKEVDDKYPVCKIIECGYGFVLKANTCVIRMGADDPNDYKTNAVTAPLFSSSTPMTIATKPAIYVTLEHRGVIARPVIFKDAVRGMIINFEQNTKITNSEGKPFKGYIKHPVNLYIKDFPINYGYTFKSIFEFKDAEGNDLQFDPPIKLTVPYGESWVQDEKVIIFKYDPSIQKYTKYNRGLYESNLNKKEVVITSYKTGRFFVAQKGKSYNRTVFKDVTTHWAKNYIEELYRKNIVTGKDMGIFAPNDYLTRAEFVKIVLKSIGTDTKPIGEKDKAPFSDVPLYSWYAHYVKEAKDLGLISGYDDGTFRPGQFINRAEAVKMLFSAFNFDLTKRPLEASLMSKKKFVDLKRASWYFPYADFAIQYGIIEGVPGRVDSLRYFKPDQPITRAEMSKLAIKTMELQEELNSK